VVPQEDEDAAVKGVRQIVATVVAVMICAGGATVFACPVCFGAEETTLISGTKLGVLALLCVLFAVQGAFVAFFLYLRKHAKDNSEVELDSEWSELQRSRT
jgi:MFS-type transporter involved in bile tolerance (Atg22 family)